MKLLILFLAAISLSFGTAYTSKITGNASSSATWGGAGVPGNGDTVTIASGTVVTVDVNTTWGTSGVNGTVAVTEQNKGQLVIGNGVFFTIRGNFISAYNGGATPLVVMKPGSTWQFDSSRAASPMTTQYEFTNTKPGAWIFLQANCTAMARCSVQSNAAGGFGYFDGSVTTVAGGIVASYTDFLRIDHFYLAFSPFGSIAWNVTHSTFNSCGIIESIYNVNAKDVVIHNNNTHINTARGFPLRFTFGSALTSPGVRQIENNVFDGPIGTNSGGAGWTMQDVIMTGNYFGQCFSANVNSPNWARFQYNLVRETTGCFAISGDLLDNYILDDVVSAVHIHNPDVSNVATTASILRNIFDDTFASFGASVDGIVLPHGTPGPSVSSTIKNNIILPTGNGMGGQSLIDIGGENKATLDIEHNTVVCTSQACLAMEYENQTVPNAQSNRGTLANNIFFNMANQANLAGALDANIENPVLDLFAPSRIMKNVRFRILATFPAPCVGAVTHCQNTNQGNGYWGQWSTTPGTHDIAADPLFVDLTRNMATFDTAYLHKRASATWASEATNHSFNVGDIISDSNRSYYEGAVINYRCIRSHVKSTANSEPGIGSAFHTYWEFASLADIRNAIANNLTITDSSIGASASTYIQALMLWVRAGFAPQNVVLHNTGTDGLDIGAVPYTSLKAKTAGGSAVGNLSARGVVSK